MTGSIAKHLRCDELFYYTFITQSADERIFKIGEHLAKLQAKWLIVSYALFALNVCPYKLSVVVGKCLFVCNGKKLLIVGYINRQINVSLLSTNIILV